MCVYIPVLMFTLEIEPNTIHLKTPNTLSTGLLRPVAKAPGIYSKFNALSPSFESQSEE